MKAFIQWWTREDILFAAAVLPGAFAWVLFESTLAGVFAFFLSYSIVVGAYEYLAQRRDWPHAAIATALKDFWRAFFNPL